MNTYTLRLSGLALVPLVCSAVGFAIPGEIDAAVRQFAAAGLASAILLGAAWCFGKPIDQTERWTGDFEPDFRIRAAAPIDGTRGSAPGKLLECGHRLEAARQAHEADRERMAGWIATLCAGAGLKAPAPDGSPNSLDSAEAAVAEIGKYLQALKTRQQLTQQVLHGSPVPILLVDSQGRVKTMNKECELLFGNDGATLASKNVDQLLEFDGSEAANSENYSFSSAGASGSGTARTPTGQVAVRFRKQRVGTSGRDALFCMALWNRSEEIQFAEREIGKARSAAVQSIVRETLLAELPLAEGLQAKARLVLGDVKQRADRKSVVERLSAVQRDLDQMAIRLRLWEWLYRTEWASLPVPAVAEVAAEVALNECCRSLAGVFAGRNLTANVLNRGSGWLCVDPDLLSISLLGMLSFAARASAGDKLELRIDKLPPSAELAEGWIVFSVGGEWQADLWPAGEPESDLEAILRNSPAPDAVLGLAVAVRLARLMQGICRAEEGPDGRRCLKLFLPTRLPVPNVLVADTEVGPREELCLGWKLGMAV